MSHYFMRVNMKTSRLEAFAIVHWEVVSGDINLVEKPKIIQKADKEHGYH